MTRRVAITGIGIASPIGDDLATASAALREGRHGIQRCEEWAKHPEMLTRLGAPVRTDLARWSRKVTRTMGRVALLALHASEQAVAQAGLDESTLRDARTGLAYGSTHGSTAAWEKFALTLETPNALLGLGSNAYLKFSTHTCAANLAVHFGIRGRVHTTCAACVSASQAIGTGYEAIRYGLQDVMICGGSEEMHYITAGVFDVLQATSTKFNDDPDRSPRPFDRDRDGLVVGEGAGTLVLEEWERAKARGATILGELVGYGTSCDGTHITAPSPEGMEAAMRLALQDARIAPSDVDYVNAHGTGTAVGDVEEARATWAVFGERAMVSSTKAFTGHTLGACGAIEAAFCVAMLNQGFVAPSRNLDLVDPEVPPLGFVVGPARDARLGTVMSNNFAFGGINTSLVMRRA
ncbi:MAG: beta-ketoacyl-ACP synthase [Sandaracinus sp.]|nr:beta-ketoacyl-ACP synthase [Sandaracinus sp.]MCB9616375.1 beta-ketoacyl-ACP synthase [Sandaracinus sp.]MCB9635095.1 beta-ketoacyl-ACP synthase [Sandaracinus sp.]